MYLQDTKNQLQDKEDIRKGATHYTKPIYHSPLRLIYQMSRRLPRDHLEQGQSAHLDLHNHRHDHL